jgi:hypothetical protein
MLFLSFAIIPIRIFTNYQYFEDCIHVLGFSNTQEWEESKEE